MDARIPEVEPRVDDLLFEAVMNATEHVNLQSLSPAEKGQCEDLLTGSAVKSDPRRSDVKRLANWPSLKPAKKREFSVAFRDREVDVQVPPKTSLTQFVTIVKGGQLFITVPGEGQNPTTLFAVSSARLAQAAPFFADWLSPADHAMGPCFRTLNGVKPRPFQVILNIAHGKFAHVSQVQTAKELFEILEITKRWDLAHLLRPYSNHWHETARLRGPIGVARALFITYELGAEKEFDAVARHMLQSCGINGERQLIYPSGKVIQTEDFPDDLVENIIACRLKAVDGIISGITSHLKFLASKKFCKVVKRKEKIPICEIYVLGRSIRVLSECGLFPVPPPADIRMPVKQLLEIASKLANISFGKRKHQKLCKAEPWLGAIHAHVDRYSCPLTSDHYQHLRKQSQKSGIGATWDMER